MRFGLKESTINQINSVFAQYPQVESAILYGSRAKGNYRPGSDIDLTLMGDEVDLSLIHKIEIELDDLLLPYTIELSAYHNINNPDLIDHIDRVGIHFYRADSLNKWQETTLGEIAEVQTGPFGSQLHQRDYVDVGTPIITVEHLVNDKIEHVPDIPKVSDEDRDRLIKYTLQEGDIVFSRVGSVDRCGYVSEKEDGWMFSGRLLRVRPDKKLAYPKFVYFYISQNSVKGFIRNIAVGTTMPSLNTSLLSQVPMVLPPLDEQRRIAAVLSTLDAKIDLLRRQNHTLEQIAQTLFKRWFVEFEFPDANGQPYRAGGGPMQPSELGEIPLGWRQTHYSQICKTITSGGTPDTREEGYWNGNIPWLSSGETRNHFIFSTEKTITELGVEKSSTRLARAGSIVVASAGQGHTRGQTSLLFLDTYINQSVINVEADLDLVSDSFLYLDLSQRYIELRKLSDSHSSRGSLTTKLIGSLEILTPPVELITRFDAIATPMIKHIHQNLLQIHTLTRLRDTLLPKLMSGKLRVAA